MADAPLHCRGYTPRKVNNYSLCPALLPARSEAEWRNLAGWFYAERERRNVRSRFSSLRLVLFFIRHEPFSFSTLPSYQFPVPSTLFPHPSLIPIFWFFIYTYFNGIAAIIIITQAHFSRNWGRITYWPPPVSRPENKIMNDNHSVIMQSNVISIIWMLKLPSFSLLLAKVMPHRLTVSWPFRLIGQMVTQVAYQSIFLLCISRWLRCSMDQCLNLFLFYSLCFFENRQRSIG